MAIVLIIMAMAAGYAWLIWPARRSRGMNSFFGTTWIAHRGLHGGGISENSMAAFEAAVEKGYGIELDVHLTKDGQLAVFHDDTLERMCGSKENVNELTLPEIQAHLLPDGQKIPSLEEVFGMVQGRVPVVVEIKSHRIGDCAVAERTWQTLKAYSGPYLVQSFDAFLMRWFKKHAGQVIRGQLAQKVRPKGKFRLQEAAGWLAGNMLIHRISSPDYVAYRMEDTGKLCYRLMRCVCRPGLAVWTVRSEAEAEKMKKVCHVQIFEGFQPHQ